MRRLLTAGIFGTILGIVGAGTVNASIVSSGFLDEKLTEMTNATTLQLDNKANQSDLTALSNKIGTLPSAILPSMWTDIPYYTEYGVNMPDAGFILPPTLGEQLEFLFNGGPGSPIERMFRVITELGGNVNTDDDPGANFLGLHPLTQKVRSIEENITLPSGAIPLSKGLGVLVPGTINSTYPTSIRDFMTDIYSGYWGISGLADAVYFGNVLTNQKDPALIVKGLHQITDEIGTLPSGNFPDFPGLEVLSSINLPLTYPTSLAELITAIYGNSETGAQGLLEGIIKGFPSDTNGDGLADSAGVGLIPNYMLAKYIEDIAEANATKIGDLPSGGFPLSPGLEGLFPYLKQPPTYPTSLAELITAIYGNSENSETGLLSGIITGFDIDTDGDSQYDLHPGILPNYELAKNANDLANANTAKIGTLPTEIPNTSPIWVQYGFAEMGTPIDLPDTIGGMFAMLFNDDGPYNEPSLASIMTRILMGFSTSSNARIQGLSSLTSVYKLTGDSPIVTAVNANTAKIGTLPTEYATVGAALTAMKSDIDAKNLPSTSDDGQYVLTAKKVGDTITYTWVKMDLTNEEQAQ